MTFLKWTTLVALYYLYFTFLTHTHTDYELIFSLKRAVLKEGNLPHKVGIPRHIPDIYQDYYDKVTLSEEEETRVIVEYSRIERGIKVAPGCAIGVGYTTCMDINFRAVDMFRALNREY